MWTTFLIFQEGIDDYIVVWLFFLLMPEGMSVKGMPCHYFTRLSPIPVRDELRWVIFGCIKNGGSTTTVSRYIIISLCAVRDGISCLTHSVSNDRRHTMIAVPSPFLFVMNNYFMRLCKWGSSLTALSLKFHCCSLNTQTGSFV